ncbi:FHA domain-containing protein [Bdellovibrionota bacterium FG-1]
MAAVAVLTILKNGETIRTCPIEGEAVLGRADGCVIRLEDRAISREHAVFKVVEGGVQVEKKSEFAPLMINGAECSRAIVKEADIISIGPYLLRVTLSKSPVLAPVPEAARPVLTLVPIEVDSPASESELAGESLAIEDAGAKNPFSSLASAEGSVEQIAAPVELEPHTRVELADDDAKTKLTPAAKVNVRLLFPPGMANVADYEFSQDEVSIGRGKGCDIVLNDKKSSRKNAIIRRAGLSFTIKDLESANGTFVNGSRVSEQELSGDDLIRIGEVEFRFKVVSADYLARENQFIPVSEEHPLEEVAFPVAPENLMSDAVPIDPAFMGAPSTLSPAGVAQGTLPGAIPGITGIGPSDPGKMDFFTKIKNWKSLSNKDKLIVGGICAALVYFALDFLDEDAGTKKANKKSNRPGVVAKPSNSPVMVTFESLSPEKQRFVEAQRNLAFEYFKNKEYDKALYELEKIWTLIPDYKDARDIQRFAKEGKRKLEALEDEKHKKEEEAKLKTKVQSLLEECKERMDKKQYEQARELFAQVSILDPDNQQITVWKKEIEDFEERKRLDEDTKRIQGEINQRAWEMFKEALSLKKTGKFHTAIEAFGKVADIGASDKRVIALAGKEIGACRAAIKNRRDPLLVKAKQSEDAGEFPQAFALYKKATQVDPPHPAGYRGMERIRGILHNRAKAIYTEAVLAESYSDFTTAKKKFQECLEVAPTEDIYHDRATRKLARYFKVFKDEGVGP